jgi:transcriptional/translational regulatory protein YebC/TACO1
MEEFSAMIKKTEELKIEPESAKLERIPYELVKLDADQARKVLKLVDFFDDDDDVQNVYHNLELTDELMEESDK